MATEITPLDLMASVTGAEKGRFNPEYTRNFVYFDPSGSDIRVPTDATGRYVIPLKVENYGFPDSRTVKTGRRELFEREEVPLNEALEALGKAVNDSMEYDVEGLCSGFYGAPPSQELAERLRSSGYTLSGQETVRGVCWDAGQLIRTAISCALRDSLLKYIGVSPRNGISDAHDVTLVLDTETGNWAVVNSKSPLKPYNLVPRERLKELGSPFIG